MSFSLIPRGVYPGVTAISPRALAGRGIRLVLADLDNTLSPYRVEEPSTEVRQWKRDLEACGITLFLLSNSRRPGHAMRYAQRLGIPYQGHAGKPGKKGFREALARMHCRPDQAVMVGDQIFTDTLGANRSGVVPLLVEPVHLGHNLFRRLRYLAETPFRELGKGRRFV